MKELSVTSKLKGRIAYADELGGYAFTREYEESAFFQDCLDEYRDNSFWADLVTRMADKAISEHLGPEYFENMPEDERRRTAEALEKSLWQECARYGIDRLGPNDSGAIRVHIPGEYRSMLPVCREILPYIRPVSGIGTTCALSGCGKMILGELFSPECSGSPGRGLIPPHFPAVAGWGWRVLCNTPKRRRPVRRRWKQSWLASRWGT